MTRVMTAVADELEMLAAQLREADGRGSDGRMFRLRAASELRRLERQLWSEAIKGRAA